MSRIPRPLRYLGLIGLIALFSCGTPEYRAERNHCEAEWLLKIPPVYRQELVTKYRTEERPTGQSTCTTTGTITHCQQVMTTISVPYTEVETVDIKKRLRSPQIKSCAVRACVAKYGNNACET